MTPIMHRTAEQGVQKRAQVEDQLLSAENRLSVDENVSPEMGKVVPAKPALSLLAFMKLKVIVQRVLFSEYF